MINELKVQWHKLWKSPVFYLSIAFYLMMFLLICTKIFNGGLHMNGAEMFCNSIGDTSLFFGLTLFVSYFIGEDFKNRTLENEIRVGYSRLSVMLSRSIILLPISACIYVVFYLVPVTFCTGIVNGFGNSLSFPWIVIRLLLLFSRIIAIQSFTILFMFISKNASVGMILSVCFTIVSCNFIRNVLGKDNPFFSLTSFYRVMMNGKNLGGEDITVSFLSSIINIFAVFAFTHYIFKKTELK